MEPLAIPICIVCWHRLLVGRRLLIDSISHRVAQTRRAKKPRKAETCVDPSQRSLRCALASSQGFLQFDALAPGFLQFDALAPSQGILQFDASAPSSQGAALGTAIT